jgi:peptide/nickel transport system substrate-binding protein
MKQIDSFIRQLEAEKLTRRQFVNRLAGLGLTASLASSILAASAPGASAATPVRGGRLKIGFTEASQKEHWDPARRFSRMMNGRNNSVYNTLVNVTPDLTPSPGLAESWDANEKADDWVFKIRKGVEFHDGRSLRAQDVVHSLRRVMDPDLGSGGKAFLSDVEDIQAENDHSVRIKLNVSNVDFPMFFGTDFLHIIPEDHTDFSTANGTGPFKVKFFEAARSAIVERNSNYWESGLPHLDEVETFAISDDVARLNAVISGDIHCLQGLSPSLIDKVNSTDGIELLSTPSGYRVPAIMRTDRAPYDNPDVRLALKHLVDREEYNQIVYKGYSTIGNDHPVGQIYPEYCDEIPIREYDPDKARSLLKKAGALDETFELLVSSIGIGALEGAVVYSAMAAKAGVNVKVTRVPTDGFWDAVWMKKPFSWAHWSGRATANLQLTIAFKSDSPWNDGFWYRDDFDKLLLESRATFDEKRRKELYCEMQLMVRDEAGQIIPAFPNLLDATSSKVKNIILNPLGSLGGLKIQNTCWLET